MLELRGIIMIFGLFKKTKKIPRAGVNAISFTPTAAGNTFHAFQSDLVTFEVCVLVKCSSTLKVSSKSNARYWKKGL